MQPASSHQDTIRAVLTKLSAGREGVTRTRSGELTDWRNPLTDLIEKEELAEAELRGECDEYQSGIEARTSKALPDGDLKSQILAGIAGKAAGMAQMRFNAYRMEWIDWVFECGPDPLEVVKRVFAYAKQQRPDLVLHMSFRDMALLLDESHAATAERCQRLFPDSSAEWNKSRKARERMRSAQQGNCNRLGGAKVERLVQSARQAA